MSYGFKVIAIGTTNVGKTSILSRISSNTFQDLVAPTTTPSAFTKDYMGKQSKFTISYWDTAGQEKFKSLGQLFYQGACFAIAIFDITQPSTFDEMMDYIKKFTEIASLNSNNSTTNSNYSVSTFNLNESRNIIVAANKIDMLTDDLNYELIEKFNARLFSESNEQKYKISCMIPTSAKTGTGISDLEEEVQKWIDTNLIQPKKANDDDENVCISAPIDPNAETKSCC